MNKVEGLPPMMSITVDGELRLRPAHKEIRNESFSFDGIESLMQMPRWVPELRAGERLCEVVTGEMFILTEFKPPLFPQYP